MRRAKIVSVIGTRPNFMKVDPIQRALEQRGRIDHVLVHTGQHYDALLSDVFPDELGIGPPHYYLRVCSGTHTLQLARALDRLEPVLHGERPG